MSLDGITLLESLRRLGAVSDAQYTDLATEADSPATLRRALERAGLDAELITAARADAIGLPTADLKNRDLDAAVIKLIPRAVAVARKAVPFAQIGVELRVGFVDPEDRNAVKAIEFLAEEKQLVLTVYAISEASFAAALRAYEAAEQEVTSALAAAKEKFAKEAGEEAEIGPLPSEQEVIKGAPVSRIVTVILRDAVGRGASDIHVEPHGDSSRVRFRIDGTLKTILTIPLYLHDAVMARIKVLSKLKLDEVRVPQDGRITEKMRGRTVDFRVSTLPVGDHEKAAIRILDTAVGVPTLEVLGFRAEHIRIIKEEIKKPHGLFLISGPTGSGKSTTLYTILNMLNAEGSNIVTLEDPIEYYISGVNQSQVRPELGYSFASGLRSVLRQDPNVIMVGEIRDQETAELVVHAALTGHLIFSTIHTNDALGVIPRLVDLGVEPFLIGATFNVATAQRLVRKICDACREGAAVPAPLDARVREELKILPPSALPSAVDPARPLSFFKGAGCGACKRSGYAGRLLVAEIFQGTPELQAAVNTDLKPQALRAEAQRQGMITIHQDGILKALAGLTTLEEVERVTQEQ